MNSRNQLATYQGATHLHEFSVAKTAAIQKIKAVNETILIWQIGSYVF